MARIEFNWSTLTRKDITDLIYSLSPKVVNQELEVLEFHKLIKNHLKKHFPIIVSKKFDKKIPFNRVFVGGTYYSDYDQENKQCIEIVLVYSSSFPYLKISSKRFKNACLNIADTLLHEIIHMRQHRRREFKVLPEYASNVEKTEKRQEQGYLGCSDEIDAYGFNIACEMNSKFNGKQSAIVKHLSKNLRSSKTKGDTWKMYLKAFDYNHNHIIIKRLKKKIIRYLPYAEIGKPYRNKDWINW